MARQPILPRRSLFGKNRSLILIFHLLRNQSFRSLQVFQSCRVWILSKYLQGDPLVQGSPLVPEALEDPAMTKRHYYNNARRQPEQEWEYEISDSNMSWDINICDISREKKASIFWINYIYLTWVRYTQVNFPCLGSLKYFYSILWTLIKPTV